MKYLIISLLTATALVGCGGGTENAVSDSTTATTNVNVTAPTAARSESVAVPTSSVVTDNVAANRSVTVTTTDENITRPADTPAYELVIDSGRGTMNNQDTENKN